jgi:hypothetical protein
MALYRSTVINKLLSKAAGESLVAYKLSRRGWLVVNANSGVQNMPNFDLIAMKEDRRVTVQVKTAKSPHSVSMAGVYREDGQYYNTKDGPTADVVSLVRLDPTGEDDDVFFLSAKKANYIAREYGEARSIGKRKRGSSLNFPMWVRVRGTTNVPELKQAMDRLMVFKAGNNFENEVM